MSFSKFPSQRRPELRTVAKITDASTGNGGCCAAISPAREAPRRDSSEINLRRSVITEREDHYSLSCRSTYACRSRQFHASRHRTSPPGSLPRPAISLLAGDPLPAFDEPSRAVICRDVVSPAFSIRCRRSRVDLAAPFGARRR